MYNSFVSRLVIELSDSPHILSLLIRERLEHVLRTSEGRELARRLKGKICLTADRMSTSISFEGNILRIGQDTAQSPDAHAKGTLASFLAICGGKIRFSDIFRGQVRISGNLFLMRRFLPLLSIGMPDEQE